MISERWQPGGDKHDSMKDDEGLAFYERVQATQEEILSCLRTVVSTWTENTMESLNDPAIEDFLHEFPEYDHEQLYGFIVKERDRVESIILGDRKEMATSKKRKANR